MEAYVNNGAVDLADSLRFNVASSDSYVTDRRSFTFFPSGSNDYGPTSVRVIKTGLNGDQWLDPRSVKLFYNITNTTKLPVPIADDQPPRESTNRLGPVAAGTWTFFRRMQVRVGGHIVEDLDYYSKLHQMLDLMTPSERLTNTMVEGFGGCMFDNGFYGVYKGPTTNVAFKL